MFGPDTDADRINDALDPSVTNPDADGDGFPDYWELLKGTDPLNKKSNPGALDSVSECCPGAPDSDGDGHSDPQEIAHRNDPNDPCDKPRVFLDDSPATHGCSSGGAGVAPYGCTAGTLAVECRVMMSVADTKGMYAILAARPYTGANACRRVQDVHEIPRLA